MSQIRRRGTRTRANAKDNTYVLVDEVEDNRVTNCRSHVRWIESKAPSACCDVDSSLNPQHE